MGINDLIDELWEESPPETATATIRTHIYHLRQLFRDCPAADGSSPVVTGQRGYQLQWPEDDIDATRFTRLVKTGEKLLENGEPAKAASALADGLALWRGRALSGVQCGPLLRKHAVHLEEARNHALELRIEADLQLGQHRRLLPELKGLVAANPLNEWFHARYIEALHRCGRRSDALRALAALRKLLREELGLDPSLEIQRLQLQILSGRDVPTRPAPAL
ncbi:AfsR/SARP family transcriptional regulator [Saccharopolyspora taberi]|uniref:AfsR/SARP family transcriptional regulator n=1 Tax=Saccharopolyspora taberi TaxID=60895 RepID=A0ABN3V5J9_9PSEU